MGPSPAAPFPLQLRNQKAASQTRAQEPQVPSSSKHRRYGCRPGGGWLEVTRARTPTPSVPPPGALCVV